MRTFSTTLTVAALAFAMIGCSSLSLTKFPKATPKATAKDPAVRCLCMWQEGEGQGIDGRTTRGFAGQVFFFTRNKKNSVAVEGDVRIFLFDDNDDQSETATPIHQFDFVGGAWNAHLYDSQFGPMYRIFVPYTRPGSDKVNAALRVRLATKDRGPLLSDLTPVILAGRDANDETATRFGEAPKFHDPRILQRNGAVKLTRSSDTDEQRLDDYLKNNSRTLGTNEQGRMARSNLNNEPFASRVQQANHEAADHRIEQLERDLAEMFRRDHNAAAPQKSQERSYDPQQPPQPQYRDESSSYAEPNRFPQSDTDFRRADQQSSGYAQALEQLNDLSRSRDEDAQFVDDGQ